MWIDDHQKIERGHSFHRFRYAARWLLLREARSTNIARTLSFWSTWVLGQK